jgi:thiol-disulfide isomerase/thioredoxin
MRARQRFIPVVFDLVVVLTLIIVAMSIPQLLRAADKPASGKAVIKPDWLEGDAKVRERFKDIEGKPAPALRVGKFINGDPVKLDQLKGKVVLLDFWATWCGPCIASIPHTNELQAKYKDKGLVVIGVCNKEGVEKMGDVVKDKGIKYLVTADAAGKTDETYKVNSYPDYYVIDRQGVLRICDCANGLVDEAVKALLDEPADTATAAAPAN